MKRHFCFLLPILISAAFTATQAISQRILHTYYDADDNDNESALLLDYWQQSWHAAGWETAIFNITYIQDNNSLLLQQDALTQQHSSYLHKWIAMSTRGGFYCHYDVFPISSNASFPSLSTRNALDTFIVYEVIAPTCMSGSMHAWQQMTRALIEHARNEHLFWTDALALIDLRDQVSFLRGVLQLDDSVMFFFSSHDPCRKLEKHTQRKHKWAVQFSPATLQRLRFIPDKWRYPDQRRVVAQSWFREYQKQCLLA